MYKIVIEPHCQYCCCVWRNCGESNKSVLQKLQHRAARIVANSSIHVRKETATLTYKSLNSLAPDYLRKLFAKCSDDRERFLRSSETDLKMPLQKTINGQKVFSYRGAKLWNCLERATKLAPSLKVFKDHL